MTDKDLVCRQGHVSVCLCVCRLVLVRLASEGEDGRFVYRQLVTHMWKDIDIKSKKLAVDDMMSAHVYHMTVCAASIEHLKPTDTEQRLQLLQTNSVSSQNLAKLILFIV